MSKITVTTIAGQTSGADANKVKIESGDDLEVVSGDLTVDTNVLKVDATNDRVGIGTASPNYAISAVGGTRYQFSPNTSSGGGLAIIEADSNTIGLYGINHDNNAYKGVSLYAGVSAAQTIDTSGRILKPLQPFFSARGNDANWRAISGPNVWAGIGGTSYSSTTGNYQQGTNFTSASGHYDAENTGSHFNDATAVFTAPVTGHYYFLIRFYLNRTNTSSPGVYLNPRINSTQIDGGGAGVQGSYHFERTTMSNSNNAYIPFGRHDIYKLSANDTFTYSINAEAAGFQIYNNYTEFKGYLIG